MTARRARTRELIELGAVLKTSGLAELVGGDRHLLLRHLVELAEQLRSAGVATGE